MPRRGQRRSRPNQKSDPTRRSAERAIAATKKPTPKLSKKAPFARRTAPRDSCKRLRKLPNLPDVIDRIKQGYGDMDVARFIHQEGHHRDVPLEVLRREVRVYRTKHMTALEVAEQKLTPGMVEALEEAKRGLDELHETATLYDQQQVVLAGATEAYTNIVGAMKAAAEAAVEAVEEGGITSKEAVTALRELSKLSAAVVKDAGAVSKAFDGARKTLMTSAQIRSLLGLEGDRPGQSGEMVERRVTEYVERRFNGRADARKVLQDPSSRARVLGLFEKVLTDTSLHKDLAAKHASNAELEAAREDVIDIEAEDKPN